MNENINIIIDFYLFARRLKYLSKHNNQDMLLDLCILKLAEESNITVAEIANILSSQISAMSEKIIKLEKDGLIKKALVKDDKREKVILISSKGRLYIKNMNLILNKHCLVFLDALSLSEKKSLKNILAKLNKSLT